MMNGTVVSNMAQAFAVLARAQQERGDDDAAVFRALREIASPDSGDRNHCGGYWTFADGSVLEVTLPLPFFVALEPR